MLPRILIADDYAEVRRALKALLETHTDWYVCGEAANGWRHFKRLQNSNRTSL